jgi:hypothetical protein
VIRTRLQNISSGVVTRIERRSIDSPSVRVTNHAHLIFT